MNGCTKHLEEAVPGCILCFAHLYGRNDALRAEIERWKGALSDEITKVKFLDLQNRELVQALLHMKSCGGCAEDPWGCCEGGRAALVALEQASPKNRKCSDVHPGQDVFHPEGH